MLRILTELEVSSHKNDRSENIGGAPRVSRSLVQADEVEGYGRALLEDIVLRTLVGIVDDVYECTRGSRLGAQRERIGVAVNGELREATVRRVGVSLCECKLDVRCQTRLGIPDVRQRRKSAGRRLAEERRSSTLCPSGHSWPERRVRLLRTRSKLRW